MGKRSTILNLDPAEIAQAISAKDRVVLGQAITLIESKHPDHQQHADRLLEHLYSNQMSLSTKRIAISGAPGVGKSSTIERLGMHLVGQGHHVAVLTIDPSSDINKGSILGDKTRMDELSAHPNAFIRPSPAGDFLGGIAWRTREAIMICESAGYDYILVETVGVGQSEFKVRQMVDCFLLLMMPSGGDELQGVKRGIVEIADILAVNKCDGDLVKAAQDTLREYGRGTHLLASRPDGWSLKSCTSSAMEKGGMDDVLGCLEDFFQYVTSKGLLEQKRKAQLKAWLDERIQSNLMMQYRTIKLDTRYSIMQESIEKGDISPLEAAKTLLG